MKSFKSFVLIIFSLAVAFSGFSTIAQAETIKLTFSHHWPAGNPAAKGMAQWAKEVEKRTNGAVSIRMFPANTLIPGPKTYEGVVNRIADIGCSTMGYTKGRFPLMEVVDLPLGSESALESTRLANAFYKKFQPKEMNDTKVMYFQTTGPALLHTTKPVRSLEDLKGLKIKTTGTSKLVIEALGGTPVAIPMHEAYDALAKGVVDGAVSPFSSLFGFKLAEVVKYTTEDYGAAFSMSFFVVMNKDVWNRLPTGVQQTIEKLNEEWVDETGRIWNAYDQKGRDFAKEQHNEIISLSKKENDRWGQKCRFLLDNYIKYAKERGVPGEEAVQFCVDYVKNY